MNSNNFFAKFVLYNSIIYAISYAESADKCL